MDHFHLFVHMYFLMKSTKFHKKSKMFFSIRMIACMNYIMYVSIGRYLFTYLCNCRASSDDLSCNCLVVTKFLGSYS